MRTAGGFLLGVIVTVLVMIAGVFIYFRYGQPPVATADKPFPLEAQIVKIPLNARIDRNMEQPPFAPNEQVYETGAKVYAQQCASCHGVPGKDSAFAQWMFPRAPQLWKKHGNSNVVGVSDDEPGETYWKVKNGIRLSGMPAYEHVLSNEEMWDVTLLLKSADQPKTPQVWAALAGPVAPAP